MSDREDQKLDHLLRSRRIESSSPELAQRIILAARQIPQSEPMTLMEWLSVIFQELHLPRPAYVLAGTLILGTLIGVSAPFGGSTPSDDSQVKLQSFLYADEAIL